MLAKIPDFSDRLRARLVATTVLLSLLGGCSVSFPLHSFMSDDDTTAAIRPHPTRLSTDMTDADWKIAEPVLAKTLGLTKDAGPIDWANGANEHDGAFEPVGGAFARDGRQCRAFVARLHAGAESRLLQGVGCLKDGEGVDIEQTAAWSGL
jgi:17 kDa outer membrane surface antigen